MTWILLQLAKYPDVQDKVRAEINEVFTDINDVTPEKLDKLKYLGAVVKETMRSLCLKESSTSTVHDYYPKKYIQFISLMIFYSLHSEKFMGRIMSI